MKPLDYILLIMSVLCFIAAVTNLLFTPRIIFEIAHDKIWGVIGRRFGWGLLFALIIVYRVWG